MVRIGLIGCGGFAGVHVGRLREVEGCEIAALCDVSDEVLAGFAERHALEAPKFTDLHRMFPEARPDAAVICTPHTLHHEHGVAALEAGCHVLMEKPMATSVEQARDLERRANESGKVFTIGYNTPCTQAFGVLRRLIRSGELGRLEMVTGWLCQDWKRLTAGKWRQEPALSGGGMLYDSGAHLFNSLVWAVEQPVSEVHAFVENEGTPVDINGMALIRFEGGVMASIAVGGDCAVDGSGMAFLFSDGLVEVDGWGGSWMRVSKRGDGLVFSIAPDGTTSGPAPDLPEASNPDKNFVDAILGRDGARTSPRDGVLQSLLMDAVYEAAKAGQPSSRHLRA